MRMQFIDIFIDVLSNYLGEVLLAITVFFYFLFQKWLWRLRDKQKLKATMLLWSPGHEKLFSIFSLNGKKEFSIYDISSGVKLILDISIVEGQTPVWSPDGNKIAFVSDRDGNNEIYMIDVDGTNLRRITDDPAEDICPQWSADGTKLTYFTRKNGVLVIKTVDIVDAD